MIEILKWFFALVGLCYVLIATVPNLFWLFWRCDEYQDMVNKMWYTYQQEQNRKAREGIQK